MMSPDRVLGLAIVTMMVVVGCKRQEIRTERIAKSATEATTGESTTAAPVAAPAPLRSPPTAPPASSPGSAAASTSPLWNVPPGWATQTPGTMIHSRFSVGAAGAGGLEVTVSVFGGGAGGVLANVNRWRGQLGLSEVAEKDLGSATSAIEVNGAKATLFEGVGSGKRIVAVILPRGDNTWFFKLLGPESGATAEKATFLTFVQSVRF